MQLFRPGLHLISLRKQLQWHPPPLNASDKRPRPSVPTLQRCLYMIEICFQKKVAFLLCLLSVFRALSLALLQVLGGPSTGYH